MAQNRDSSLGEIGAVLVVLILCVTFCWVINRLCLYGEKTTWKEVEMKKAEILSSDYWKALAEARKDEIVRISGPHDKAEE